MSHDLQVPHRSAPSTAGLSSQRQEADAHDRSSTSGELDDTVLLRAEGACRWLDIGRTKLFELIADGDLTTVTVGRSRRIPVGALRAYVAGLKAFEPEHRVTRRADVRRGEG